MPPKVKTTALETKYKAQIEELEKEVEILRDELKELTLQKGDSIKKLTAVEKKLISSEEKCSKYGTMLETIKQEYESKIRDLEAEMKKSRTMEKAMREQVDALLELQEGSVTPTASRQDAACGTSVDIEEKGVSKTPIGSSKQQHQSAAPDTNTKVKSILNVWESKKKPPAAPLNRLPGVLENVSPTTSRVPPVADSITLLETSFEGPILEIPEDLLEELNRMDPIEREKRLSNLPKETQKRVSMAIAERSKEGSSEIPVVEATPQLPVSLPGRVAAALKLFAGSSVPKPNFFSGVSLAVGFNKKAGGDVTPKFSAPPISSSSAVVGSNKLVHEPSKPLAPHNTEVDSNIDGAPMEDDQIDQLFVDVEEGQLIDQKIQAAVQVAKQEAQTNELEKSLWLADIEEIKIASTPAKSAVADPLSGSKVHLVPHEWSVVSQKMNLSCQLTPVVPGRRSCVVWVPKMKPLGPKNNQDQYEISDKDTDSETEISPNSRAKKHIPSWCSNWRQKAVAQIALDPESIFGLAVPKCDLDVIFTENNYKEMGLLRPNRVRGSSGNWTFDKLTQEEVDRYRAKCGQVVKAEGVFQE